MNAPVFGTVLGYHTVAELKDLVLAKDVAMRNLGKRLAEVSDSGKLNLNTFVPSYNDLVIRYSSARDFAQKAIDAAANAWRNPSMIVAEDEWNNLLTALNPHWRENTWTRGDGSLDDLYAQIVEAGSTGSTDEPTPQPQSGTDVDFNALTATTQATQALESLGGAASNLFDTKHLVLYSVLGGAFFIFVLPRLVALSMPGGMLLRR
jgi:hypothetical protein